MTSKNIAEQLLEIEAVFLRPHDPFTWSSGIKSPIYCDNRLTLSFPELRKNIATQLSLLINSHFPEAELIAGTATAGIPHAAWVSDVLELPMCYVRSSAKSHGKGNQIEGKIKRGQKAVVVEDLISTGGSAIAAVEALRSEGIKVLGIVSIFSYELDKGKQRLEEAKIKAYSLTGYSSLIEVSLEKELIKEEDKAELENWRKNPELWGNQTV
ncbi:orotate phosphoribosyltransferase [Pseudogracilibacillus auburnensis]|uniref:orotate phosphoribosyltransferase n=1 Tax=Pseudogracilibacillus auburnensis TaxID=1494959 RepID=UPI001A958276|nr:orotate phosphoribosyltransferase [Pseudogracilibacillus auburnensis]MBO1004964.1 orotate phosphoribosyltransferase [Pseudogracilibacillus auburnensis]